MKAHYKVANGRLTFEVQGETPKELFSQVASLQEVFEAESACGCCQSTNIRFQHRKVEDFDYYELACREQGCRARFQFGQAKKGGALFPKRKDEDGNWLPNGGWSKYEKQGTAAPRGPVPPPPQRSAAPQRTAQPSAPPSLQYTDEDVPF